MEWIGHAVQPASPDYSYLSATIGSTRQACRAGCRVAISAIPARITAGRALRTEKRLVVTRSPATSSALTTSCEARKIGLERGHIFEHMILLFPL